MLQRMAYFYYVLLRSNFAMWFGITSSLVASKYIYDTEYTLATLCYIGLLYGLSYDCTWSTMNQYSGAVQDELNQRKRVLELDLIKPSNLRLLMIAHSVIFILIGHYLLNLAIVTSITVAMFAWYTHLNGDKHWMTQLIISMIVMMIYVELPHYFMTNIFDWKYAMIMAVLTAFPNLIFADLKDTFGDKKVGRKTIPIMIGDGPSKLIIISCIIGTPIIACMVLVHPTNILSITCLLPSFYRFPLIVILANTSSISVYRFCWVWFGFIWEAIFLTSMPFCANIPNLV